MGENVLGSKFKECLNVWFYLVNNERINGIWFFDFFLWVNGWIIFLIVLIVEELVCFFDFVVYEVGILFRCVVKYCRLVGFIMMGIYFLFVNVMLFNIFIVMFRCFYNVFVFLFFKLELYKLKLLISKLFLLEKK